MPSLFTWLILFILLAFVIFTIFIASHSKSIVKGTQLFHATKETGDCQALKT